MSIWRKLFIKRSKDNSLSKDIKLELEKEYGHFWLQWKEFPEGEYQRIEIMWIDGPAKDLIKNDLLNTTQWGRPILPQLQRQQSQKSKYGFGDTKEGFDKWRTTSLPIVIKE